MVVCVVCGMPAWGLRTDKPWDVVSVTRRSSGVAPRACVRVYARVCAGAAESLHTYIHRGVGVEMVYVTACATHTTGVCGKWQGTHTHTYTSEHLS